MLDSRPLLLVALTPDGVTMDTSFSDFAMIGAFLNMAKLPLRAGLVFWLFLLSAIAFLDRTNISIAGPQISHEYGVGNVWLGWIISPFLIGYASSQVLARWIAVRLGPRSVLTLGVLWWGAFTLSTALIPPRMRGALWIVMQRHKRL
jgi:ACS family glucarate transporter-like MFS transporter